MAAEGVMSHKEIRIGYDKIRDPNRITQENVRLFRENDLNISLHEIDEIIDDDSRKERIYKVRKVKFIDFGRSKK